MNAFEQCRAVEARSFEILKPLFAHGTDDGRYVLTDKGRLSGYLQQMYGDVVAQVNGEVVCIEVKAEEANKYGNFFIEEWSNKSRWNRGWLDKLETDLLFYHFIEDDELYVLHFETLREWAFDKPSRHTGHPGRMYDYARKQQSKRVQRNDTWGRCVPIQDLLAEMPYKLRNPASDFGVGCAA